MTILLQVLLLVLGISHYSQGQTLLDCSLRTFCEDRKLTQGFINALSKDIKNFVQFDCDMTIFLDVVQITWFYQHFETGSVDPGSLNVIYSNVPGKDMFRTSVAVLNLSNFTYGPVRSRLVIRDVKALYEGTYSCAEADKDVSTRQYEGCLFVLGQGVFEYCKNSLTGCHNSSQSMVVGGTASFDLRVTFIGGGDCAHQAVTHLKVIKDSQVVYLCEGSEDHCDNEEYPRFEVFVDPECKVDCKYYFHLLLHNFMASDAGVYTAEVLLEGVGDTLDRKITRTIILEVAANVHSGRSWSIGGIIGPVLSAVLVLVVGCALILTTVLIVTWRKNRTASLVRKGPGSGGYGTLPDLDELQNAAIADLDGSSSHDSGGYQPVKAHFGKE